MKAENRNKEGCPCADRLETEKHTEARSDTTLQNPDKSGAGTLLAKILERDNLNRAYKRVKANKGAPGIDGMSVEEASKASQYPMTFVLWCRDHPDEDPPER